MRNSEKYLINSTHSTIIAQPAACQKVLAEVRTFPFRGYFFYDVSAGHTRIARTETVILFRQVRIVRQVFLFTRRNVQEASL